MNRQVSDDSGVPNSGAKKRDLDWWLELLQTLMLGIAALATAWSGYQSARWNGLQSTEYTRAQGKQVESLRAESAALMARDLDIGMFGQWVEYYATGQTGLADFYRKRFRREFVPAFEAWLARDPLKNPDVQPTPFTLPEYKLEANERATTLQREAEKTFALGRDANANSDLYQLDTVFMAMVMFLSSMNSRLRSRPGRVALGAIAVTMLAWGVFTLAVAPLARS